MVGLHKLLSGLIFALVGLSLSASFAQVSGVPGDGVPDFYYYATEGAIANTVLGPITRPLGILTVDTDGSDMVLVLIGGPNALAGCDLCDNGSLPDPDNPPLNNSSWTVGYINSSTQWVRTNPLDGIGFVGVIGEYDDPLGIFPDVGLANYGAGATFDAVFVDGSGAFWEVVYAGDGPLSPVFLTNVTFVTDGDFDFNAIYNILDLDALVTEIVLGSGNPTFDLNGDGFVDASDLSAWLATAGEHNLGPGLSYLPADATLDGSVDGLDFIAWNNHKFTTNAAWSRGDFNADGEVDALDFALWNDNKFTASSGVVAVPEASAIGFLFVAMIIVPAMVRQHVQRW